MMAHRTWIRVRPLAWAAASLVMVSLGGCYPAPSQPAAPSSAAVGISVQSHWATLGSVPDVPEWIYFVRLEGDDLAGGKEFIPSNYRKDNRFYLLNAEPGRYAAVAASDASVFLAPGNDGPMVGALDGAHSRPGTGFARPVAYQRSGGALLAQGAGSGDDDTKMSGDNYRELRTIYFSEELVRQTVVEVTPGTLTFAGTVDVRTLVGIRGGDPVQLHYRQMKHPVLLDINGQFVNPNEYRIARGTPLELSREREAERAFLEKAQDDLKDTDWGRIVERQLARLR